MGRLPIDQASAAGRLRARALSVALLVAVGGGSAWYLSGSAAARAQSDNGSAAGLAATPGITPAPSPCSGEPPASGACPTCTSDVPGASDYENGLPVPTPHPGFNYVVQLVNESNVTILAAANAAHRGSSSPGGAVPTPIAVLPREGTWLMQPKGSADNANILTIDIPEGWEGTECTQANSGCAAAGPRFYPRTGCRYDIAHNLAQCETGTCGDAYDCGQQSLRKPPLASTGTTPVSIVEWTFNSQGGQGYEYPDISIVDGANLTIDVQALGPHCESKPGAPSEPNWLSQNQPLAKHGADLREPDRCIPSFRLTRGEVGQIIEGGGESPDDVVACFTNCGRYEYPTNPGADCDPETDEKCKNWLAFCCFAPAGDPDHVYGSTCSSDADCKQGGGCWNTGAGSPMCACRAFIKGETCAADVCTHANPPNQSSQPPFGHCSDVTSDETACIGDDTVHEVFTGAYTWPNDPQTYSSDARAYRIIFAPGWTEELAQVAPITNSGPVPLCSSFTEGYGYEANRDNCAGEISAGAVFAGAQLSGPCDTPEDCPIIQGSNPSAHYGCYTPLHRCATWSCQIADGGPVSIGTSLCRWSAEEPSPSPTRTQLGGPEPTDTPGATATPTPGRPNDGGGCSAGAVGGSSGSIVLALVAAGALLQRRRRTEG